jgi:copper transporter 1
MNMGATNTMVAMSMPTSGDASSSGIDKMKMGDMAMTFFTSSTTSLYSKSWTPTSTGQYAGTCIFLIFLAAILRALLAARLNIIGILAAFDRQHTGGSIYSRAEASKAAAPRPWRANEAVILAFMDFVLAGIGYLLSVSYYLLTCAATDCMSRMIAVMTMNVGYFMSVLSGVFVGSLIFGRFMAYSAAH